MCGIFGWVPSPDFQHSDVSPIAQDLLKALQHRGPNDQGYVRFPAEDVHAPADEHAAPPHSCALLLGHTRLSILDLSPAGHQPMFSECGRYCLVYNGEIYNFQELRTELRKLGHVFRTQTDTEVVLHALIQWHEKAFVRFTGMFALAFFDRKIGLLLCARDFFGIKPFFWHKGANGLCFASELPALLRFPNVPRRVNPTSAYQYLCHGIYDDGAYTMLRDIHSLPPAHYAKISLADPAIQPKQYWKPDIANTCISFADAKEQLRQLFLDSVRLHLRSDVPLGVALSGGIDSSSLTCAVRYLEPERTLHTFSFIVPGYKVSEEKWASLVAKKAGAVRHTICINPHDLARDIDELLLAQGEPFGSTSIYAQYKVFQLASNCGIRVTLDGQGADELLAGYEGYPGQRFKSLVCSGKLLEATRFIERTHHWPGRSWTFLARQVAREFTPEWLTPFALRCIRRSTTPAWLDCAALRQNGVCLIRQNRAQTFFPSPDYVKQALAYQLTVNGLPHLLRHADRSSMAHSIESRVPFLTRDLAEFCLSLPEDYLIDRNGRSKSIFREAMRGIAPDKILDRRDKIGFATPETYWLTTLAPWVETTLTADEVPYLLIDEARSEWRAICMKKISFDWKIWRWLCYIRWCALFEATT